MVNVPQFPLAEPKYLPAAAGLLSERSALGNPGMELPENMQCCSGTTGRTSNLGRSYPQPLTEENVYD